MARGLCHLFVCTPLLYQQPIRESARKFPGMAWYLYDIEFRRRASHNLSINWGQSDVQLYLETFTGVPKARLCKACSSLDHITDSCPLSLRSTDSPGHKRGDFRFNFNKGVPCTPHPLPLHSPTNLDALHPDQERTTLTPQALGLPSQRLAAQAIPPKGAIEYISKLSPTTPIVLPQLALYLHDHPDRASIDAVLTGLSQGFKIGFQG